MSELKDAYNWALSQKYESVAARYSRMLALHVKELESALSNLVDAFEQVCGCDEQDFDEYTQAEALLAKLKDSQ